MYISKFEQALVKMPEFFTSNEYTVTLRKLEVDERIIKQYQPKYLKEHCLAAETRRTWYKRNSAIKPPTRVKKQQELGLFRRFINWIY